jgi:hypothetical protein
MNDTQLLRFGSSEDAFAVEGSVAPGAKGVAPGAGQPDNDPDWQPL